MELDKHYVSESRRSMGRNSALIILFEPVVLGPNT